MPAAEDRDVRIKDIPEAEDEGLPT